MSVGGGVGVDEDTGATCLLPGAHLTIDGPDAILVDYVLPPYKSKKKKTLSRSDNIISNDLFVNYFINC